MGRRLETEPQRPPGSPRDLSGACRFVHYCLLRHANYLFDLASCRSLATEAHIRAVDRALHELATGPYDGATRTFVNEQLRQERERILDRIDRYGWARSAQRTPRYGEQVPTRELQRWMSRTM